MTEEQIKLAIYEELMNELNDKADAEATASWYNR